jgi:hypothetical protein
MSDRLLVATRKGLFIVTRTGGRWRIDDAPHFLGDPVSMVLFDRRDSTIYAALNLGHFGVKMRRSTDDGRSWEEHATPTYPEGSNAKLAQIWALEPGGRDERGVLWAGTIPGGLFRSADRGDSWTLVEGLWNMPGRAEWFGGGADQPGLHSVCVDARDSRKIAVAVSSAGVWITGDGGETWRQGAHGMRAAYMPPDQQFDPNVQDPHLVVQAPSNPDVFWAQHHNGIFRSTDASKSWQEITTAKPSAFGFAVAVHPKNADTAWFVPAAKDECRVPVDGKLVVSRTKDGGRSFEVLSEGLPQQHAYDLIYRHGLAIDETGERLAMGSTTGGLWITDNGGDAWRCVSTQLPPVYAVKFA